MNNTYPIMQPDGTIVNQEPLPGKWYVGMMFVTDKESLEHGINYKDCEFGEYVQDGEFICEDWQIAENPEVDMGFYDFLQPS